MEETEAATPRMVNVCPGCGSRDVQVTAWIDCNTARVIGAEGPFDIGGPGGAWCPVCQSDDQGLTQVEHCEDCDGKGWEVFECGYVHEVQRCDLCQRFEDDETATRIALFAGLFVDSRTGQVNPEEEARWRAGYPAICAGASS